MAALLSRPDGRGLLNGKFVASGLQDFANGVRLDELKAIAEKRASLANRGRNRHGTGGKRNVQLHDFAHGNVLSQHGADSDLADVQSAGFE
jgi:hypothetical protein